MSELPLSTYTSIPIPQVSASLPPSMFIHPSTPRQYTAWESSQHPLTCWHLTYFPASANNGQAYTGIGFARSHGIFDGVGAAYVMRALVAELNGEAWVPPPLPAEGLNVNPLAQVLNEEEKRCEANPSKELQEYKGYSALGLSGFLKLVAWHLREKWWNGADRRIILLPKDAFAYLIDGVKDALRKEGKQADHITSGDILVAWACKTIYASGISPETRVHCSNFAAFRSLLAKEQTPSDPIASYTHNAFIPLPYPILSVAEVRSSTLHDLTDLFATSRLGLSKDHIVAAYKLVKLPTLLFPSHPDAYDSLTVSNVSASRILESDWSATGAKRTLCGYRYQLTPTEVLFTNAIYIAGRLDDGSVVLDVALTKVRVALLEEEVKKLTASTASTKTKI
ncbi:hypothetical protein H1R20_g8575, partial [Candolleomyces eurysporus]